MIFWIVNAPKFNSTCDLDAIYKFIDTYISCSIPSDNTALKDLVLKLQKHTHSSYCKKQYTCRFQFPKPPCQSTLITSTDTSTLTQEQLEQYANIQKK